MMKYDAFAQELGLAGKVVAVTRLAEKPGAGVLPESCSLAVLKRAMAGERVVVTQENVKCGGARVGFGFVDGLPDIPGGFGAFIAGGRGAGFPPGERIKRTPELGEAMLAGQPQGVMAGFGAIALEPYREGAAAETVTALVDADQLAALVLLFNYEKPGYENVIMPMSSGCASVFRIPFGELARGEAARAVVGGVDLLARLHFPAGSLFFTAPGQGFARMVELAEESVLAAPFWKAFRRRLAEG